MKKVLVFTSTRADYGILRTLIGELDADQTIDVSLLVTGTHLSDKYGMTISEIHEDGYTVAESVRIPVDSENWLSTVKTMGRGFELFGPALDRIAPDLVVILGDRFEAFTFASVCHLARVPIVHLHGGEVTVGALDDSFRHSITKFASLHLVAADQFANRVVQLGEHPSTVKTVGAVGLDTIRRELADQSIDRTSTVLVTQHPTTIGNENGADSLQSIIEGLLLGPYDRILVTRPNIDSESASINDLLDFYEDHHKIDVHKSLGSKRYLRELATARLVVGNSSSGIIEAPFVGTPVVNVGGRQLGRPLDAIVVDLPFPTPETVLAAAIEAEKLVRSPFSPTIYGDGHSAPRCATEIATLDLSVAPKQFYDLEKP